MSLSRERRMLQMKRRIGERREGDQQTAPNPQAVSPENFSDDQAVTRKTVGHPIFVRGNLFHSKVETLLV